MNNDCLLNANAEPGSEYQIVMYVTLAEPSNAKAISVFGLFSSLQNPCFFRERCDIDHLQKTIRKPGTAS